MRTFVYSAAASDGALSTGSATAASELELDRELEARGLVLTRAREVVRERRVGGGRVGRAELARLTAQLATVCGAGVPLVDGLEGIAARSRRPRERALVLAVVDRLRAGETLSEALEAFPASFPPVYRASVRAGEASGSLGEVLARLAGHLEWARAMRATTAQALVYPGVLLFAVVVLIAILLYHVLPGIVQLFPGGVADLPAQTRAVLALSDLVTANAGALALSVGTTAAAFVLGLRAPAFRAAAHRALLLVPGLGGVAGRIATAKLASTAATLQAAGCEVFTVLREAAAVSGNAALEAAVSRAAQRVERGSPISEALAVEPLVDPLLVQMVAVGESTGRLDETLATLARHYDAEVPRAVKRMLSLFEPGLLLVAGAVVAFLLSAVMLPLFEVYDRL